VGTVLTFTTLKKRSEFLRVRGGVSWGTPAFLLQARYREQAYELARKEDQSRDRDIEAPGSGHDPDIPIDNEGGRMVRREPRFGFTVTKKIGNAVVRNRIRRRLKAALSDISQNKALPDCDYVLVARRSAAVLVFSQLVLDLSQALDRVHAKLHQRAKLHETARKR